MIEVITKTTPDGTQTSHNQFVCNATDIILVDHVCLLPGYVTVRDGKYWQTFSDDPNNRFYFPAPDPRMAQDPNFQTWIANGMLKNRLEYQKVDAIQAVPEELKDVLKDDEEYHFVDLETMFKWIEFKRSQDTLPREEVLAARDELLLKHAVDNDEPVG